MAELTTFKEVNDGDQLNQEWCNGLKTLLDKKEW